MTTETQADEQRMDLELGGSEHEFDSLARLGVGDLAGGAARS